MASVALINYYARLLLKGYKNKSDVPPDIRDAVLTKLAEISSVENNPGDETPKEDLKEAPVIPEAPQED